MRSRPGETPTILFGAFDRHNFGDLLFPHVVAALLVRNKLVFAGLAERDLRPYGGHRIHALARLAKRFHDRPVNIIHAGGELLTCDAWEAAVMLLPPAQARTIIGRPEASTRERLDWARQALGFDSLAPYMAPRELFPGAARIIYNAVGGVELDARDPALQSEALAKLAAADDVGVRDRVTQALLEARGIQTRLLPDCAVMTAELFGTKIRRHACSTEVGRIRRSLPEGYIAVQFSADFGDDDTLDAIAGQLARAARASGCGVVFFRAGAAPWHDDLDSYARIAVRMRDTPVEVFASLNLWDICALLACSRVYVGSSLHGRIVAMAFGLPRVNLLHAPVAGTSKQAAYAGTWEAPGLPITVGVRDIAEGLRDAMSADRDLLARKAAELATMYSQDFAALTADLA